MRLTIFFLVLSLLPFLQANAGIEEEYESFIIDTVNFDFWKHDKVFCAPASKSHQSAYPNADHLLDLASADRIVVFTHGFQPHKYGGEQTLKEMVDTWKYHIDLLEGIKGKTSYCVVTWDSDHGFDDPNFTLTRLMLLLDMVTSDQRLDNKIKTVTYTGHSAGGNYIKFSHVQRLSYYTKNLEKIKSRHKSILRNQKKNKKMHIVTLGTPHLGTSVADTSQMTALFGQYFLGLMLGDRGFNAGQHYSNKASSRGAKQLRSLDNNPALYQLNRDFEKNFPKSEIFALAGLQDSTVSVASASPYFSTNYSLNFKHDTFLQPYNNSALMGFLRLVYQGEHPKAK